MSAPSETSRKIVVAVDDSKESEYAVAWMVQHLVKPQLDQVVVLTCQSFVAFLPSVDAIESGYAGVSMQTAGSDGTQERIEDVKAGTHMVEGYMKTLQEAKVSCTGEVLSTNAVDHLIREVKKLQPDIVVIGSHGRSVLSKILLGSVGDSILHDIVAPIVVVRPPPSPSTSLITSLRRCIVVAVDESKEAEFAFQWAMQNFCREEDKVLVLHVQPPSGNAVLAIPAEQYETEDMTMSVEEKDKKDLQDRVASEFLIQQFMNIAASTSKIHCEGKVVAGTTTLKLMEEVKLANADAVVVGARSMGPISRTFIGSVSDFLAHNSPCPVLVAKSSELAKKEN